MKIHLKVTVDLTTAEKLVWEGVRAGAETLAMLLVVLGLTWVCWPPTGDPMTIEKALRFLGACALGLASAGGVLELWGKVSPAWRTAYWVARHDNGIEQLTLFSYSPTTTRFR